MKRTHAELLEKIRLSEDSFLELKEVRFIGDRVRGPAQGDLVDELAAFANSAGGVLVLGVEDRNRAVVGTDLEGLDAVESLLRQACEDSVTPPLAPIIERLTLPDAADDGQSVRAPKSRRLLAAGGLVEAPDTARSACTPVSAAKSVAPHPL